MTERASVFCLPHEPRTWAGKLTEVRQAGISLGNETPGVWHSRGLYCSSEQMVKLVSSPVKKQHQKKVLGPPPRRNRKLGCLGAIPTGRVRDRIAGLFTYRL